LKDNRGVDTQAYRHTDTHRQHGGDMKVLLFSENKESRLKSMKGNGGSPFQDIVVYFLL
jgi:hypothetical protein